MPASTNTNARREREPFPPSRPYTPTAVCLYPNGLVLIPGLKRIFFLIITNYRALVALQAKRKPPGSGGMAFGRFVWQLLSAAERDAT